MLYEMDVNKWDLISYNQHFYFTISPFNPTSTMDPTSTNAITNCEQMNDHSTTAMVCEVTVLEL